MTDRRIRNSARKGVIVKLGLSLYFAACLFSIVSLRTAVFSLEYELGELDRKRAQLISERKMISAERASFYSTGKIEEIAIRKLGMSLPERNNVFFVKRTTEAGPYRASLR